MIKGAKQFKEHNDFSKAYRKEYASFSYKTPKADMEYGDIYGGLGHEDKEYEEIEYKKPETQKAVKKARRIKETKEKKIKDTLQKSAKRIVKTVAMTVATATSVVTISVTSNGAVFPGVANWAKNVGEQLSRPIVEVTTKPLTLEQFAKAWEEGADVVIAEMNGEEITDESVGDIGGEYHGGGEETGVPDEEVVEELAMSDENESESVTEPETTEAESSSEETSEEETLPASTEETTEESTEESTEASSEETSTEQETTTAAPRPKPTTAPTEAPTEEPTEEPTTEETECEHENIVLYHEQTTGTVPCTEKVYICDIYICSKCSTYFVEDGDYYPIDSLDGFVEPGMHSPTVEPIMEDDGSLKTVNIYCENDGCPEIPKSKPAVIRASYERIDDTSGIVSITINGGTSDEYTITEVLDGGTNLDISGSANSVTVTGIEPFTDRLTVIVDTPYMFGEDEYIWYDITFHLLVE